MRTYNTVRQNIMKYCLSALHFDVLSKPPPPFSLDMTLVNFHLFLLLRRILANKLFNESEEVKNSRYAQAALARNLS